MKRFAHALIVLVMPVILVLTWLRVLLTPVFIRSEYHKAAFPPDPYGFGLEDRLHWSEISRQYLLNREGIQFLGAQTLPDGTPLYNARELRHMADVKKVVSAALLTWAVALLAGGLASAYLVRRSGTLFLHALQSGSVLTVALLVAILAGVVLAWNWFFVFFHRIFFAGDTWLFLYSDSLIRLFPEMFWQDCFVTLGVGTGMSAAALWVVARFVERRLRVTAGAAPGGAAG
ncbi:MAG: TIGR01906 family membrane protein [Chloroflexi bacterium]|nr:TIGR01906 family membrane protein [Chloroflexota bacterium]